MVVIDSGNPVAANRRAGFSSADGASASRSGSLVFRWMCLTLLFLSTILSRTVFAQLVAVEFWAQNAIFSEETDEHYGWGGTKATFGDTTIESDAMILQKDQGRLIAQGNVRMARPGVGVYAEQIVFDFASGYFQMSYPKGFFVIEAAPKDLFYFTADEMKGYPAEIEMRDIMMSSCSFDCPKEYRLTGSRARLKPGRSLEVWNATAYIYAVPVFYLPYMYLNLRQMHSQVGVRVGKNKTDGKFAYITYNHTAKAFFIGLIALTFKEKTGTKYEINEKFRNKWLRYGETHIQFDTQKHKRTGQSNQNYRIFQEVPFSDSENKKLKVTLTRNSTYQVFTSVRQYSQTATLEYNSGPRNLKWDERKSLQTNGVTRNKNGTFIGPISLWGLKIQTNSTYTSVQMPGRNADELLKLDLKYQSKSMGRNAILSSYSLQFNRDFDLDGSKFPDDNKQSVNFNYPLATFTFNSNLWSKNFIGRSLFVQSLYLKGGGLKQGPRDSAKKAGYGDLTVVQGKQIRLGKSINLTLGNNFTQSMYDSGDARYTVNPRADLRWDFHPAVRLSVGFQSNSAKGGSPFQLLSSVVSRTANWNLDFGNPSKSKWSLRLGTQYDLKTNRKQPISFSFNVRPSQNFNINGTTQYNSVTNQWSDLSLKFALSPQKPISYNAGLVYSLDRDRLLNVQAVMDLAIFRRTSINIQGSWTPTDKEPFIKKVYLVKYNCCTFYELAYETRTKSIIFNFGITAFPQERLRLSGGEQGLLFSPPGQGFLERGIGGS